VNAKGLGLLAELGCLDEILTTARTPIASATVYVNGRVASQGSIPRVPGLPPHGHAVPRDELDAIVFRHAQAAGAATLEACTVGSVAADRRSVTVEATIAGERRRLVGRVVVGADGAQSAVAAAVGAAMQDPRYVVPALRGYCRGVPFGEAILYLDEEFFPGYGWVFPVAADLSNVGVGVVKESLTRQGLALRAFYARLQAFVTRLAAERGHEAVFEPPRGWPIKTYGGATTNVFARGLLVGDAGCFVDPISGEGIPLALETAKLAGAVLDDALRRDACDVATLATYDRHWRARYDPDLKLADLTVAIARNRHFGRLWIESFRLAGMAGVSDDVLARTIGGIMAGVTPARAAWTPELVLRALARGPALWMAAAPRSFADVVEQGFQIASWQAGVALDLLADGEWSRAWLAEVRDKWLDLLRGAP
jgi:flavin-dependent dehydrogenase